MNKLKITKQNIPTVCFIVFFALCMLVPVAFMNFKPDQVSNIENKKLTDWPKLGESENYIADVEDYVDDRIGFREAAIEVYTELNNSIFGVMVHPLFMWGEEGHIFYKDKDYIAAYQRINTDKEYIDSMAEFLTQTNEYLSSKGIEFLYFVCPDKKTIYSEYFPKTVNVNYENESVLDYLDERMAQTDVKYINPKNNLLAARANAVVYNRMYDATHWNDLGGIIGEGLIDEYVQEKFDDVPALNAADYDLTYVNMDSLDTAKFRIDEDVPLYVLREDYTADYTELLKPEMECNSDTFYTHHINSGAPNNRILLVFTDSYLQSHQKFYDNRFKEVYFVHRQNYDYLQYFVNLVFPDMVIFETAERSISSEMPLNTDFEDYYYEPAYQGDYDFVEDSNISYEIVSCSGGRVEGSTIYLNPNDTSAIFKADGVIFTSGDDKYDLYIRTADECMETDYCKLHRDSIEDGIDRFQISIQRRYMAQSYIELFAYNEQTKETVLLTTFEVAYDE